MSTALRRRPTDTSHVSLNKSSVSFREKTRIIERKSECMFAKPDPKIQSAFIFYSGLPGHEKGSAGSIANVNK